MSLDNIISKYLLNKTDQQELEQLKVWQAEAQDNVNALEEMQQLFSLDMSGYKSYDKEKAWDKVEAKLEESPQNKPPVKSYSMNSWIMSAAAILTIVLASTFVWKKYVADAYPLHYETVDATSTANLPDETIVKLDRNTSLDIISDDFASERSLSLSGRAFFTVAKDSQHPFTINLPQGKITVLGTQFSITTKQNVEEIYVTEGNVRYDITDRSFDLKAGDFIKVVDGDVIRVALTDTNYLSWKKGKLVLHDVNIVTAIKSLSNHYQKPISLAPNLNTLDCKITTTIEQESLKEALEELSILLSLQYKYIENGIVITDIKC